MTVSMKARRYPGPVSALIVVSISGALVAAFVFWTRNEHTRPVRNEMAATDRIPATATTDVNPAGYVGPEKCAACHRERVQEFRGSRHYNACVAATDKTMPAVFLSGDAKYSPHNSTVRFQMRKIGDQFVQIAIHETPAGVNKTVSPISLMYGFGAGTDEVYFTWTQNKLSELPMCWLHSHQEWGTSAFDRSGSGDFSRPTNLRCIECHNTWLEHIPGTPNQYRPESLIAGVTCEVCHGPGKEHVYFHETHPASTTPMYITQPAELSRSLQMDLCANCHSNALRHRGPAFSYRPGKPLKEFYKTLTTRNPEDDHVANQTTYLKRSKCYQQSDTLTCVTCHDPHVATDMKRRGSGQSACMTCHQPEHCKERHQLPNPVQDNCVGCHMPRGYKIQVTFDTSHDIIYPAVPRWEHRIAVYPIARDEILLAWHKSQDGKEHMALAKSLSKSLARTMEQQGDHLHKQFRFLAAADAYRRSLALSPSNEVRRKFDQTSQKSDGILHAFARAENDLAERRLADGTQILKKILAEKPDHAKAHGRLGTMYAMEGENEKALKHWKVVSQFDPDDAYGEGMIGWHWYLQHKPRKAVTALLRADEMEPYSFRVNFNLALAYVKLDQLSKAADRLATANQIRPQNVRCALMLNKLLRQRREYAAAAKIVERLSKRTLHRDITVEIVLADSQAEAGQTQAAIATLEAIQRQVSPSDPRTVVIVAERLRKLRITPSASMP